MGQAAASESAFRNWYASKSKQYDLNPDPDAPEQFYDYRAAFKAGAKPDASGHWPSDFKRAGHPNMVVGGFNVQTGERVQGTPQASEHELVRLGWDPATAARLSAAQTNRNPKMAQPAFDPSQPFTVVGATSSPSGPTMGPPTGREPDLTVSEFVNQPQEGVTLGEIMENPTEGFARMGAMLKRDLTDPKTWLAAAAMYFGPKALPKVAPLIRKAMGGTARLAVKGTAAVGDVVAPEVIGMVSPRAGRAVELAQRLRAAMPQPSAAPAAPVAPPASAPVAPAAPVPQSAPPPPTQAAAQLAQMKGALTSEEALAVDGLVKQGYPRDAVLAAVQQQRAAPQTQLGTASTARAVAPARLKLTAPEAKTYVQLRKAGKTDAEIFETIAALRQLTTGKTATDAQVKATVAHRNRTGRW